MHDPALVQMATIADRCVKQYRSILEVREVLVEIQQKKQKLMELSSAQMTAAERAMHEKQVGVHANRMHEHNVHVNMAISSHMLQSSCDVLLTRGRGPDEDLVFDEFPPYKLLGKNFFRCTTFDEKKITYDFEILKVRGHVRWRHKKSKGSDAKLKLARFRKNGKIVEDLEIAKYIDEPDEEGFTKTTFEFTPANAEVNSSYRFWNPGSKGIFRCI